MRDLIILLVHLFTSVLRIVRPGGVRSVVAESVLIKHQVLIVNRSCRRAPKSPRPGSADRRILFAVDQAKTPRAIGNRIETINSVEFPSRFGSAQIQIAVFAKASSQTRAKRS
jgi:hypothetical protein